MLKKLATEMAEFIKQCAEEGLTPGLWDALSFEKDLRKALRDTEGLSVYELRRTTYGDGNLAIVDVAGDGDDPYPEVITVNLGDDLEPDQAYLDINGYPNLVERFKQCDAVRPTGRCRRSGFVMYPLYEFDLNKIAELMD